jgi:hypothetical protein
MWRAGRRSTREGTGLRQQGSFFVCRHCANELTVTEATLTRVRLISAVDQPEVRVVLVAGIEVHRRTRRDRRFSRINDHPRA